MAASLSSALRRWFMPGCSPPPMGLAELPTSSKAISSIPNGCRRFRRDSSAGCFRPLRRGSFRTCSIENREITAPNADGDRSPLVLRALQGRPLWLIPPPRSSRARCAAHSGDLARSVGPVLDARNERRTRPCSLRAAGNSDRHRGIFVPLVRLEDRPPDLLLFRPRVRQRFSGAC